MTHLSLAFLGPLHVARDDGPVTQFAYDKVRALLVYLAVEADRPQRRDVLAELLWPDQPPREARGSLRQALVTLRHAIGDHQAEPPFLLITQEAIQFNPASDHTLDVADFLQLLTVCTTHTHHALEMCTPCRERMARAAELYRGSFLEQFAMGDSAGFEAWVMLKRAWFQQRAFHLLSHLTTAYERLRLYERAQEYAWRQVALDPWREEAHRALMRLLALAGQRSAALRQYDTCRRILAEELDVVPMEETTVLAAQIRSGEVLVQPRPSPRTPDLPPALTSFVGRRAERQVLTDRLTSSSCRLLTLIGPPGIGKTRLSLQVAADLATDFEDGVSVVSLAPIRDPDLITVTIAQALGVTESAGQSLLARLQEELHDKHLLLVLDNFEQVMAASPIVSALLKAAPHLTVMVTSRAILHLSGEHAFPVASLVLPDPTQLPPVAELAAYDAVDLFLQRTRAVNPQFELTPANARDVADLCVRLGGLPLAIELAAVRSTLLPPQVLLQRLERPLPLLTGGPRDVDARHQTMRSTIAWSYHLLTGREQLLFARLSVFVGGCSLEAVEAVCSTTMVGLDLVGTLVDQSLVQQVPGVDGAARFTMLELIREYAGEQLEQRGELAALRDQHAVYYLQVAEGMEPAIRGREQQRCLDRLTEEQANCAAALAWLLDSGACELALRLVIALTPFWVIRCRFTEGRRWLDRALVAGVDAPAALQARALTGAGRLAMRQSDTSAARSLLERGLDLARAVGERALIAAALSTLASVLLDLEDAPQAANVCEESLALMGTLGDTRGTAEVLLIYGLALAHQGDDRASALWTESLRLARAVEDGSTIAWALFRLANVAAAQGEDERARELWQESLVQHEAVGDIGGIGGTHVQLGCLARAQGDLLRAETLIEVGLRCARETGNRAAAGWALHELSDIALLQHDDERAACLAAESLTLAQHWGAHAISRMALINLSYVACHRGNTTLACRYLTEQVRLAGAAGNDHDLATGVAALASIALGQQRPHAAVRLLSAADGLGAGLHPLASLDHHEEVTCTLTSVRAQLDAASFAAAWEAGRLMTREQIIALAWEGTA